jgi:phosphoglycerate dehydrogenase-like enzyme
MTTRPLVIQTEELSPRAAAYISRHARLEVAHFSTPRFEELLPLADALVVRTYTRVDRAMLDRAPNLRVVGRAGVGLDRIDVEACAQRNITVVHTPDANSQAVAELVFALLHDAVRPRLVLDKSLGADEWNALRKELTAPRQINELTIGVLGLGRIGGRVAKIAGAYGAKVYYNDLLEIDNNLRYGAEPLPLAQLLAISDILTIHIDPRPANHKFVSTEFVSQLKSDVVLINTARGVLVDAPALAAFLWANPKATALLDVHDPEPFPPDYPLLGLPNAHLSPHIAAATAAAHENMSMVVVDVVRALFEQAPHARE